MIKEQENLAMTRTSNVYLAIDVHRVDEHQEMTRVISLLID